MKRFKKAVQLPKSARKYIAGSLALTVGVLSVLSVQGAWGGERINTIVDQGWSLSDNNPLLNKGEDFYYDTPADTSGKAPDFIETAEVSLSDLKDLVDKLDNVAQPSEVEGYAIHEDGGLIYNPVYQEASATGILNKYNKAHLTKGTLQLGNATLTYEVPQNATAYDTVPIKYTLKTTSDSWEPVHVEANSFEETERTKNKAYYDLNLPNDIRLQYEYLGYVTGDYDMSTRPILTGNLKGDRQGTEYPNMDRTDLTLSTQLPVADHTWFKIRYTNIGDTILDPDGNSIFSFVPQVQVLTDGGWADYKTVVNGVMVLTDALYPGETRDIWVSFPSLAAGKYRISMNGQVHHETSATSSGGNYTAQTCVFEFEVVPDAEVVEPESTLFTELFHNTELVRNYWLHTFQEFLSTYDTWLSPEPNTVYEGVLFLQMAPWTKSISLKLIEGDRSGLAQVTIPINVDTESVSIRFNPNNVNYVIDEDGKRFPMITTQSMADMRTQVSLGPDADSIIVNQLIDMQEAGINVISQTNGFTLDESQLNENDESKMAGVNISTDAFKFSLDAARVLGLQIIAPMNYPYQDSTPAESGSFAAGELITIKDTVGFSDPGLILTNAARGLYAFNRWGDLYWTGSSGFPLFFMEDTRGRMGLFDNLNFRDRIGETGLHDFQSFLESIYGDVATLNREWGSNFSSFSEIDPEKCGTPVQGDWGIEYVYAQGDFTEWSVPMRVFDIWRTVERVTQYRRVLDLTDDTLPNGKMMISNEIFPWIVSGINPETTNPRLRYAYYVGQRGALVPEVIQASGTVYALSDYVYEPAMRPSEVYELTKRSVEGGVVPMYIPRLSRIFDQALNSTYGTTVTTQLNASNTLKGCKLPAMSSTFLWMTATYEAGGVPGIFWQDYTTGGTVSTTQVREMKFFKQKLEEALQTPEGKAWAEKGDTADTSWKSNSQAVWSYNESYVREVVESTMAARKPDQPPT